MQILCFLCLFLTVFRRFFHVYNKKCSFLIVVFIWSIREIPNLRPRCFYWLLCGYWSFFLLILSDRCPKGWASSFLFFVDCPSKLYTIYSIIDSFSAVTFFWKVIHNFWNFHLGNQMLTLFRNSSLSVLFNLMFEFFISIIFSV